MLLEKNICNKIFAYRASTYSTDLVKVAVATLYKIKLFLTDFINTFSALLNNFQVKKNILFAMKIIK